jgi:hypothetical protein
MLNTHRDQFAAKTAFVECTQEPPRRATLNTDGRGCVARSLDKGTIKRDPKVILTDSGASSGRSTKRYAQGDTTREYSCILVHPAAWEPVLLWHAWLGFVR